MPKIIEVGIEKRRGMIRHRWIAEPNKSRACFRIKIRIFLRRLSRKWIMIPTKRDLDWFRRTWRIASIGRFRKIDLSQLSWHVIVRLWSLIRNASTGLLVVNPIYFYAFVQRTIFFRDLATGSFLRNAIISLVVSQCKRFTGRGQNTAQISFRLFFLPFFFYFFRLAQKEFRFMIFTKDYSWDFHAYRMCQDCMNVVSFSIKGERILYV